MAKKYFLLARARRDLRTIVTCIARENPPAARKIHAAVLKACEILGDNPHTGQVREDLTSLPVRFWPAHPNYLIVYNPSVKPIQILRIFHSAQNIATRILQ